MRREFPGHMSCVVLEFSFFGGMIRGTRLVPLYFSGGAMIKVFFPRLVSVGSLEGVQPGLPWSND
jgi:hypothetical protein